MNVAATYGVLDVKTPISEISASLAAPGKQPAIARAALQELVGVSLLMFERGDDGRFAGFRHLRVGEAGENEATMLRALDGALRPVHDAGGVLVTFNGARACCFPRRFSQ